MKPTKYIRAYKMRKRKRIWVPIFGSIIGLSMLGLIIYLWIEFMALYYQAIGF